MPSYLFLIFWRCCVNLYAGLGDRLHKDLTRKCHAEQINQSLLVVPTTQYR
jgi:hypothetical protein